MTQDSFERIEADLAGGMRLCLEQEAAARATDVSEVLKALEDRDHGRLRQLFGEQPPLALVAFDTPGIQHYVFKVARPGDRQGGSNVVADLTRGEDGSSDEKRTRGVASSSSILRDQGISPLAEVYGGAGGGLVLTPAHRARAVIAPLEAALERATHGDLVTAATALEVWPSDLEEEEGTGEVGGDPVGEGVGEWDVPSPSRGYPAVLAALFARLDRRRADILRLPPRIPATRQRERCQACGERPATTPRRRGEQREEVCAPCLSRGQAAGRLRREVEQARTSHDLFAEQETDPMLALVYADGANFGQSFSRVGSPAQHRALSLAVESAFERALAAAVRVCGIEEGRYQAPIRGGDDLVVLLSARHASRFICALVPALEKHLSPDHNQLLRSVLSCSSGLRQAVERFGVGVGVAIADDKFPDRILLGYARELLKNAKARIHQSTDASGLSRGDGEGREVESQPIRSAVDFMVLRSGNPLNGSIRTLRAAHFERSAAQPPSPEPALLLTLRPYSFAEFQELAQRAEALHMHVGSSQIHAVARAIQTGYWESQSFFRYQNARAKDKSQRLGWAAFRCAVGQPKLATVDELLWQERGGRKCTDFLDAIELCSLMGGATENRR